jgi:hypothetical protein
MKPNEIAEVDEQEIIELGAVSEATKGLTFGFAPEQSIAPYRLYPPTAE